MNDARKPGEGNGIETSPTQNALLQHSKRVAYQQYCEQSGQNRPTPDGHLMRTVKHGFQCGTQYLWPRRPACRELSVAARAKGDVVLV